MEHEFRLLDKNEVRTLKIQKQTHSQFKIETMAKTSAPTTKPGSAYLQRRNKLWLSQRLNPNTEVKLGPVTRCTEVADPMITEIQAINKLQQAIKRQRSTYEAERDQLQRAINMLEQEEQEERDLQTLRPRTDQINPQPPTQPEDEDRREGGPPARPNNFSYNCDTGEVVIIRDEAAPRRSKRLALRRSVLEQ